MNNLDLEDEEPIWYIFTFGCGQAYAHKYVKLFGTFGSTREEMQNRHGSNWSMQYKWEDKTTQDAIEEWGWTELK